MGRVVFLLALFLSLPGCIDQAGVDFAFCDSDEECYAQPQAVVCGGVRCDVQSVCYTDWHCNEDDLCVAGAPAGDFDDGNLCTVEVCDPVKGWKHRTPTAKEIDDGDECTLDECDPAQGVTHTNTCT